LSGGFFRSTSIVGAFTLISRVSGLLRDMVYSRMFGAGVLMDAFLVAFKIPNFMRRLFAEGAFSQAFVPVVSEYKVQRSHDEVRELVDGAAGTMAWFLSVVTIIGVVAAPLLVLLFAPGFREDAGKFDLTVEMLRSSPSFSMNGIWNPSCTSPETKTPIASTTPGRSKWGAIHAANTIMTRFISVDVVAGTAKRW